MDQIVVVSVQGIRRRVAGAAQKRQYQNRTDCFVHLPLPTAVLDHLQTVSHHSNHEMIEKI
jgi:hypothetical protein